MIKKVFYYINYEWGKSRKRGTPLFVDFFSKNGHLPFPITNLETFFGVDNILNCSVNMDNGRNQ